MQHLVGGGGLQRLGHDVGVGVIGDDESGAGAQDLGLVGEGLVQQDFLAVHHQTVNVGLVGGLQLGFDPLGSGGAGACLRGGRNSVGDAALPAFIQLVGAVQAQGALGVGAGGGVVGVEVVHAVDGLVAHDNDQVTGGVVGGAVLQIGIAAALVVGVTHRQGNAAAAGQLLTDEVQIGVMAVVGITVSAGQGSGKGPVAEAVVVEVKLTQGDFLREQVQRAVTVVEHHGQRGGAADDRADGAVTAHLGIGGGVQQHLFGQLHAGVGVIHGDGLTLQGVLDGGAHVTQGGGDGGIVRVQHELELNAGRALAAGAADGEDIGVHLGQILGGVGGAALDVGAPLAPGQPARPGAVHIHIGPCLDLHPGTFGRVGAPAGHHVLKGGNVHLLRGPGAFGLTLGQAQGAVAHLGGDGQVFGGALVPGFGRGETDEVILMHVAPGGVGLGKGGHAESCAQRQAQDRGKGFFQVFHSVLSFLYQQK